MKNNPIKLIESINKDDIFDNNIYTNKKNNINDSITTENNNNNNDNDNDDNNEKINIKIQNNCETLKIKNKKKSHKFVFLWKILYKLFNFNLFLLSLFLLLLYMNLILFIGIPVVVCCNIGFAAYGIYMVFFILIHGIVKRDRDFDHFFPYKILKIMLYVITQLILVILELLCLAIVGSLLILGVSISIVINIIFSLTFQTILWPFVDSFKPYLLINKVINGYCQGLSLENKKNKIRSKILKKGIKFNIKNSSIINNTNSKSIDKIENNNGSSSTLSFNYIYDYYIDSSSLSSSTLVIQDYIYHNKITIPIYYFEDISFFKVILNIWLYRWKKTIIMCTRWWYKILIRNFYGFYILILPWLLKYDYINKYDGYRFFLWNKNSMFDQPIIS